MKTNVSRQMPDREVRMTQHVLTILMTMALFFPLAGCQKKDGPPQPVQQGLTGEPLPALLLTHAWFWNDADGKPRPGWARLDIWRNGSDGWSRTRLEDSDSNVFHKAIPYDGGILTIGAERALIKLWRFENGRWTSDTLWERSWGGQFDRMRDVEIGDVDHDGEDEIVVATHDSGVVAVIDPARDGGQPKITEMDQKADTFVHEIEIGDIDGDGKLEFFATTSDRNRADYSQAGGVVMYRWNGDGYERTWVDDQKGTHAKEILAYDVDGNGKSDLFSVLEAEVDQNATNKLKKPVEIRQYTLQADGSFTHHAIGTVPDRQTRFLVAADFDGDGRSELITPAMRTGIYYFRPPPAGSAPGTEWTSSLITRDSSGFEHAAHAADLDGDGKPELYVAADDQGKLVRYDYDGKDGFRATTIGDLEPGVFTWNITTGTF